MKRQDILKGECGENFSLEPLGNGIEIYVSKNHTFGTDAVLLSHFASPKKSDTAVDLGTGCGIIPFLWFRDKAVASATGLEISPEGVALANASKIKNGNPDTLTFIEGDIKTPFECLKKGKYSLVTCNPPYKAAGAGIISESAADKKARHETACDLRDVIAAAAGLLKFGGRFAICQRPERLGEIFSLMTEYKLEPKKLRLVCKSEGCEPWLVLVEGRLGGGKGIRILPNLNLYKNGELSEELLEIEGSYINGSKSK
ncbi:MAG: methyltransferase domain-containing protein [Clostridia bacterium]|nr:methyltransferase domain-containing protein [Clostridia bacterium]